MTGSGAGDGDRAGVGVRVRAPATSANLGPAFDAAGLALDWWDTLEARPAPATSITVAGEQADAIPVGRGNLVLRAMRRLATEVGADLPPLRVSLVKGFPLGRGFGSSAAAVALGLLAARALLAQARRLLPAQVRFAAATRSAGRAALLPLALGGDFDLLLPATEDVLHQPARLAEAPRAARALELLRGRGRAVFLSGAGPSLLLLCARAVRAHARANAEEALAASGAVGWQVRDVDLARIGACAEII